MTKLRSRGPGLQYKPQALLLCISIFELGAMGLTGEEQAILQLFYLSVFMHFCPVASHHLRVSGALILAFWLMAVAKANLGSDLFTSGSVRLLFS
jgi:hypothetical protein